MTIIKPHTNRQFVQFITVFFAFLLLGGLIYIFQYNALVNARAETNELKNRIVEAQTELATLKNGLYQILDPVALSSLASQEGLTVEKYPRYVTVSQL